MVGFIPTGPPVKKGVNVNCRQTIVTHPVGIRATGLPQWWNA